MIVKKLKLEPNPEAWGEREVKKMGPEVTGPF